MRIGLLALLVAAAACGGGDAAPSPTAPPASGSGGGGPPSDPRTLPPYVPPLAGDAWETVPAAALGWDATALASALEWAGTQRSTAVLVLWRGRIVAERYWSGWTPAKDSIIASAGKSIASFVMGQLAEQRRLDLDAPATRYLGPGWSRSAASESAITVRHLLGMTSGLDDSLRFVAAPGTRFYYNNPAYYQTFGILAAAGGVPFSIAGMNQLFRAQLFNRIGMRTASWRLNIDTGEPGFVLSCSARDMARFGLLVQAGGRWGGDVVLADTAFLRAALSPSSAHNPSYGLLWWLNGQPSYRLPGPYLLPSVPGPLIPSGPRDLVAALGKGDKKIYVSRALELVVVRHGEEADLRGGNPLAVTAFDEQFWQRLRLAIRY